MEPTNTADSSNEHLKIFNPVPHPAATFSLFPRLPIDIRYLIWEKVLSHERLLRIFLKSVAKNEKKSTTNIGNTRHRLHNPNREYRIILRERQAISKLFHVTSESR
ncbi:2EXR domain-containing protein [Fusarium keratoplasticum]|uniref:2EXR domain-containing protein n=1 Tax=Fusarium keratoplasticum TaxID=1328300 RepID=A0ACC0QUV0_9HYPO|nr:2EXR domain-containing protein [Fusarium keratoplasticum]KAI8668625.1 2EXR domain-containing protein [Fusarium keratoplasticum]